MEILWLGKSGNTVIVSWLVEIVGKTKASIGKLKCIDGLIWLVEIVEKTKASIGKLKVPFQVYFPHEVAERNRLKGSKIHIPHDELVQKPEDQVHEHEKRWRLFDAVCQHSFSIVANRQVDDGRDARTQ